MNTSTNTIRKTLLALGLVLGVIGMSFVGWRVTASVSAKSAGATLPGHVATSPMFATSLVTNPNDNGTVNLSRMTITGGNLTGTDIGAFALQVVPPVLTKVFNPTSIPVGAGGRSTLTFDITNPSTTNTLTGVTFTDTLPAGLIIATPNNVNGFCTGGSAGVANGNSGGNTTSLLNTTLVPSSHCTYNIDVTATTGGTKLNSVTANSSAGQSNTAQATLTVIAPCSLTCPANITASNDPNQCGAVVNYPAPTTSGICGTVTCSPGSGSFFPKGTTTVTCTASGAPQPSCTFTVTVNDTQPPTITCPANIAVGTTGNSAVVNFTTTASDNCPGVTVACTPPSGSSFNVGVRTVTCTATDASSNTATCSFTVTVNRVSFSLSDPLACTGPGNAVTGTFSITNNGNAPVNVSATVTLPATLPAVPGTCASNVGVCAVTTPTTVQFVATLTPGQTATVSYLSQVGDQVLPGTQLCANLAVQFGAGPILTVQACITVTCPAVGPGSLPSSSSPMSDQKAGSVLIYNVYTSGATSGNTQNTRINVTNTHPVLPAFVHLFFVAEGCSVADSFICLTGNQTASFLASDLDPGTTGYIVAIASDALGCPTNFNFLIGDEYVKFTSGHAANLGAEAVSAIAGGLTFCNENSVTATLFFDGFSYNVLPRVLALDNVGSRADGNDTLLIVNRLSGNLGIGANTLGTLFGIFYDDAENALSYSFTGSCQLRSSISNNFPRLAPRFETFIPAGRTGWTKFWSQSDFAISGSAINFNPNAGASAGAFNQGHNLHILTNTAAGFFIIPLFPPSC